jgi:hypothetical protein
MNPARETVFRKTAEPFAVSLTDWLCHRLAKAYYLNVNVCFYGMFFRKIIINCIKCFCMKISFSAFSAYFSINAFDDV